MCEDYIVSLVFELDAHGLLGADLLHPVLNGRITGDLKAPKLITPSEGGLLDVPSAVWISAPPDAVAEGTVLRLREEFVGEGSPFESEDFYFREATLQAGPGYEMKPDPLIFRRPVEIALAVPEGHEGDEIALYTYNEEYGIWIPDVPDFLSEDKDLIIAELERVIAAKKASNDLNDHFPPDYSHIPMEPYGNMEMGQINNRVEEGFLVTETNHFCLKSLFADLEVSSSAENYTPFRDGSLDDMCQTDGFGWVRNSNDSVHCGGSLPSARDQRLAERKTRRIIDQNGVALRFRDNLKDFFNSISCPGSGSSVYCYDLDDFKDDVEWAVNVWREAINRNPDGSWEERYSINCWDTTDSDGSCAGDEIDIGIKDIDPPGRNCGKNITIDENFMNDVVSGDQSDRVAIRSTLLHEMGHALGLDHWAGPGTLMSYQGRGRRNDYRINLCGTYSQAQMSNPGNPLSLVAGLSQDCQIPELDNRWGTTAVDMARINRATCTDIMRIRGQIDAGSGWTEAAPLQCEIITGQTEYAAIEMPVHDPNTNEAYFVMDFDLRFQHCGDATAFDRLELEILKVDADNRSREVRNLYNQVYRVDSLTKDDSGFYTIPVTLDSRNLVDIPYTNPRDNPYTHAGTGMQVYRSFSEYMADQNIDNLAMVLRVYKDTISDGSLDEFVAGSTGLLRSPILTPVDARVTLSVTDVTQGGVSLSTDSLIAIYSDFISSPDLFPYTDNATMKPNVGKVMYCVVPPRTSAALTDPDENLIVEFTWEVPDMQFAAGSYGPALIWVDSIEITREQIPTIADWGRAGRGLMIYDFLDNQ